MSGTSARSAGVCGLLACIPLAGVNAAFAAADVIECSPLRIGPHDSLRVLKHDMRLDELAVVRPDGVTWVFLVVGQPPAEFPALMSTEQLAETSELEFEVGAVRGLPWVHGATAEAVFTEAGRYRLVLSDVLESDEVSAECLLDYDPQRPPATTGN